MMRPAPINEALASLKVPTTRMKLPGPVVCAYGGFALVGLLIFHTVGEQEASSVLTLSALAQCLGVTMLCIQSISSGSAEGMSAKSLLLDAFAIIFRLTSTLWLDGYLPSDRSGDFVYQAFDVSSLLLLIFLLHRVLVKQSYTYQAADDTLRVGPLVVICVCLAALLHGDMDDHAIFDTTWLAGLFIGAVAVLPQFWLIVHNGGWAGALTSHYIAAMAVSRILSGCFMWMARYDILCEPYVGEIQHTIIAIFIAHAFHAATLADFAYHYVCNMLRGGLCQPVQFSINV
jgi:hypothetical protein